MEFVLLPWLLNTFPSKVNSDKLNRAAEGHGYAVQFVLVPWLFNFPHEINSDELNI